MFWEAAEMQLDGAEPPSFLVQCPSIPSLAPLGSWRLPLSLWCNSSYSPPFGGWDAQATCFGFPSPTLAATFPTAESCLLVYVVVTALQCPVPLLPAHSLILY